MTWRRQPLCVVLLAVMLFSTIQLGTATSSQSESVDLVEKSEPIDVQENNDFEGDNNLDYSTSLSQDAVYPSSTVGNPKPTWEPTPNTMDPSIFDYHYIQEAQGLGIPPYDGTGVRVSVVDYGVDIGHPDLYGSHFVQPSGTYQGWPVAFDPASMRIFLQEEKYEGTWYANTTFKGQPPFEVMHSILVDGRIDFGPTELLKEDPPGGSVLDLDGDKQDFDLTSLYVAHDEKFWYFGFDTHLLRGNVTYGLLIDVNNETGGTTSVPEGKLVNTNTSHYGAPVDDLAVNDVAVNPNGSLIATTSGDKIVRLWRLDGKRLYDLKGHGAKPYTLAWSPDGRFLASRDENNVILWDINAGGQLYYRFSIPTKLQIDLTSDLRYSSSISFSPNSAWLAVGGVARVHVYDVIAKRFVGNMTPGTGDMRSVVFNSTNPTPPQLAVGVDVYSLDSNTVRIFELTSPNLQNIPSPPIATSIWNSTANPAFGGHSGRIIGLAWSQDGSRIVSTGRDNYVKLWQPSLTLPTMSSNLHGSWVYAASWERTGSPRFATVSKSSGSPPKAQLQLWDYNGNSLVNFTLNRTTYAVDWTNSGDLVTASLDLSARIWSTSGLLQRVLVANKPDFAVMIDAGLNYSLKDLKWEKVVYNGTFYAWNDTLNSWSQGHEVTKPPINGTQAFFGVDEVFVELGVPTSIIGNVTGIAVEMFSTGRGNETQMNISHAQDSVPKDGTVFDLDGDGETDAGSKALDWSLVETPLSAFQYIPVTYYQVNTTQIPSVSGTYHFGYHPSQRLAQIYGSLGVLVADPFQNGTYEKVYIDMNNDKKFDNTDVVVDKNNPIANYDWTVPPDGIPDISAGMIYFIADGVNYLPYSERFRAINGLEENRKPEAGDLVAFAGEFRMDPTTNEPSTHGTQISSMIASRGVLDSTKIKGIAPATKLIPLLNGPEDVISSWYFAVEGYDGTPGTGDEAQIVINPFEYPRTRDDGYDVYSRTADYLSTSYSGGRTVFFGPAGEEGPGYGSVASPAASPGIITVGRTVDNTLLSLLHGGIEGPNIHYNNIAFSSSRGPTVSGFPKPDLVAIGNTATDVPLFETKSGKDAISIFGISGSEVSATIVAGVSALLMDAAIRNGTELRVADVRNYLMSGAENLGYDILLQGAGFLNASRSMRLLLGNMPRASVLASPPIWVPGSYKGTKYDAFTNILFPGEGDQTTFKVENRDDTTLSLSLTNDILEKTDGFTFTNKTTQYSRDLFLWMNRSGVFVPDLNTGVPIQLPIPPISSDIWNNSELLKLTVFGNFSHLIIPSGEDNFETLYCYDLILRDWTWDSFGFGYPSATMPWEMNTIDRLEYTSNVMEARVHRPGIETHDAIVIILYGHNNDYSCRRTNLELNFIVDFYDRTPWNWISLNPTSLTLSPGQNATVLATVTIPSDAAMGSYESAIYITDMTRNHEVTIPVLVNVGANSPNFYFGGNLPVTDLNDVNRIYGGRTYTLIGANVRYPYTGDWRFFYVYLPDEGLNIAGASIKMVIQLNWTVKPSDIDMVAYSPSPAADIASQFASTRFGPQSLREVSASEVETKPKFKTLSNSSQDYISFQLAGGLNVIGLHQMILNGDKHYETFWGSGMWWRVPREMRTATQRLNGTMSGNAMLSNVLFDGLRASAVGPAVTSHNRSEVIEETWQDWMRALPWGQALAQGSYDYCIELKKVLILDVHLIGLSDVIDLDLGLFRDKNDDCKLDEVAETGGQFCTGKRCEGSGPDWAYDADGDADEQIKWTKPPDGKYIIKVLGFDIPAKVGHFDLDVEQTLDTGTGYMVPEAPKPAEIIIGTSPVLFSFTTVNFSMSWDFPGDQEDGNYSGAVQLGTATASGIIVIPAVVILDRVAPTISSFSVSSISKLVNESNPTLTNDPLPTLIVSFEDPSMGTLDRSTFRMELDGKDVSDLMRITLLLVNSPFAAPGTTGPWGYWKGDISYSPLDLLNNGVHILYVRIGDEARNYLHQNFTFTIDLLSPMLTIAGPSIEYTRYNVSTIQGNTEPNAFVQISGQWYQTDSSGDFSIPVSLSPGINRFDITSTQWFSTSSGIMRPANPVTIQKKIVRDEIAPIFLAKGTIPSGLYINTDAVQLVGQVSDEITAGSTLNPTLLTLYVNGEQVTVLPDGTYSTIIQLQEGANTIELTIFDPAGNNATDTPLVINRDSVAPVIDIVDLPERVETNKITLTIQSEPQLKLTVNGFDTTEVTSGEYQIELSLSPGTNTLIIKAEDRAKNVAEVRVSVVYGASEGLGSQLFGPAGGMGAIAFMILIIIIVILVVFFMMRWMGFPRRPEEEGEVAVEEGEVIELPEEKEEGVVEELEPSEEIIEKIEEERPPEILEEPKPPEKPVEEKLVEEGEPPVISALAKFRLLKSKSAYEEGRISKSVYEQNIASLGLTVPQAEEVIEKFRREEEEKKATIEVAPSPPKAVTVADEKAARLKEAYEAGRISKEIYIQNLKTLGLPIPSELEEPKDIKVTSLEEKKKMLRKALDDGKITQEMYEENLKRLEKS